MKILLFTLILIFVYFCKDKQTSQKNIDNGKVYLYVKVNEGTYTYESTSFNSETIDFLPQGTKVELVEITNELGSLDQEEGLWAKVFYNKFEGFVFLPHMQTYPPLDIDFKNDRVFSCITYSNKENESDSIDYFIFKRENIVEHLWMDEKTLEQGLDVQYFKGSYEETNNQIVVHSKRDYELFKYENGFILLKEEDLKKIEQNPNLIKVLEKAEVDGSPLLKENIWVCQRTYKLILD
ncbi:MAG: hypothetical protein N3A69_10705 [Leptospiraceae bacterium]|nr:hypothetical protein [Leptospiraceae bacterium]